MKFATIAAVLFGAVAAQQQPITILPVPNQPQQPFLSQPGQPPITTMPGPVIPNFPGQPQVWPQQPITILPVPNQPQQPVLTQPGQNPITTMPGPVIPGPNGFPLPTHPDPVVVVPQQPITIQPIPQQPNSPVLTTPVGQPPITTMPGPVIPVGPITPVTNPVNPTAIFTKRGADGKTYHRVRFNRQAPVDGTYIFRDPYYNTVLAVQKSALTENAPVVESVFNEGANQVWAIRRVGNSQFAVFALHSQKALTAYKGTLVQATFTNQRTQHWRVAENTSGTNRVIFENVQTKELVLLDGKAERALKLGSARKARASEFVFDAPNQ